MRLKNATDSALSREADYKNSKGALVEEAKEESRAEVLGRVKSTAGQGAQTDFTGSIDDAVDAAADPLRQRLREAEAGKLKAEVALQHAYNDAAVKKRTEGGAEARAAHKKELEGKEAELHSARTGTSLANDRIKGLTDLLDEYKGKV